MVVLDTEGLRAALNADPEFRLAARLWTTRLVLRMGERRYLLEIRDGEVREVVDEVTIFDPWEIELAGPEEGWEKLLQLIPPPFYQDVFPAILHHGFTMGGDLESLFAYYPAVRRMLDVVRDGYARPSGNGRS